MADYRDYREEEREQVRREEEDRTIVDAFQSAGVQITDPKRFLHSRRL